MKIGKIKIETERQKKMLEFDCAESVKLYNELAREQMILQLLKDIRVDLEICEIEGWDKLEYLKRLKFEINRLGVKNVLDDRRRNEAQSREQK